MIRSLIFFVLAAHAVPVDLRPSPLQDARQSDPAPAAPVGRSPAREILASRHTLDDLLALGEALHEEAWNIDADANDVWTQWRAVVGVALNATQASRPSDDARRSDGFALHTAARVAYKRSGANMSQIEKAETAWWKLWRALDANAKAGEDPAELLPAFERLKTRMAAIAGEINGLDATLRQVQGQYDFVRPMLLDHASSRGTPMGNLRQPWHWNYALTGKPRPERTYDFAAGYEKHYDGSHEWLRARGRSR